MLQRKIKREAFASPQIGPACVGFCLFVCHYFRQPCLHCKHNFGECQRVFSTMSFLMLPIALAGLRPFGQVLAQFRMVWQR